jgi:hypothetical protein
MKSAREVADTFLDEPASFTPWRVELVRLLLADRRAVVDKMKDAYGDRSYNENREDVDAAIREITENDKGEN